MIIFVLTEDMSMPMVMADRWTILMIVVALVNVVLLAMGFYSKSDKPKQQVVS